MGAERPPPVRDDPERGRFEIEVEGAVAFLEYTRGPSELVLVHTEVPRAIAGRGLGGRLARHALELAREEGLRVELVCPFQIAWLDRHPEYRELLHRPTGAGGEEPFWLE